MFTASSLLLLTLILNVQLCSPAPIWEVDSSSEVSPTANIAEEPVLAGDLVSAYTNEGGPQELAPRELLVAVPQEYSEDDAAFADASSEDTEVDILPESPVQHHVEDPAQIAPIVMSLETSEYGAPSSEDDGPMLLTVPDDNAEVEADTSQEPLLKTSEEEESAVLVPAETEDEEADQQKLAAEETAPEESAVIVLKETAQQEPDTEKLRESVQVVSSGTKEATEHVKDENAVVPNVLEENSEEDLVIEEPEEEPVILARAEIQNKEADQDKFAAEEAAPEEPAVIVLEETAEQEPITEKQREKKVNIVSSDMKKGPEHLKEEDAVVMGESAVDSATEEPEEESVVLSPAKFEDEGERVAEETVPESGSVEPAVIVPVDSSEGESEQKEQVKEEPISTAAAPEAEDPVTVVPADLKTNKEGQEEIATQELTPEVVVLVEPTSEEPSPEDVIFITPLEDPDKKVSEYYMEEEKVQSDHLPQEPTQEMYELDGSDGEILIISVTETTSGTTAQDPAETVPITTTEILNETSVEPVTSLPPAVTDAEVEIVPASVEGVSVTGFTAHSDDFKAAGILTENESAAHANRGAVLGAAFFTLVSFIIIGIVGAIVSKKLRRLRDTEVKII